MFKMGGSTTPRENFAEKGYTDFLKSAQEKYAKQQEALKNMGGVQTFKNLSRLTPFLQQDTNNPLKFLSNIVSDPELLGSVVLPGMTEQKKAELLANDPKTDLAFAKAMKPQGAFGEKVYQTKKRDLAQINKKIKDSGYFTDNVFLTRLANVYVNMNFLATQIQDADPDSGDGSVSVIKKRDRTKQKTN